MRRESKHHSYIPNFLSIFRGGDEMTYFSCKCGCEDWKIKEDGDKLIVVCKNCGEVFDENLFVYKGDLDLWKAENF